MSRAAFHKLSPADQAALYERIRAARADGLSVRDCVARFGYSAGHIKALMAKAKGEGR